MDDQNITNKQILEAIANMKTELKEEIRGIRENCVEYYSKTEEKIKQMEKRIEEQENRIQQQEKERRSRNVIIHGIEEKEANVKELEQNIIQMLHNTLKLEILLMEIDVIYRLGPKNPQKTRPIMVKFLTQRRAQEVLKNRRYLKNTKIYVNEDITKEEVEKRRKLVDSMKRFREQGKHAIIKNQKLIVNGKEIIANENSEKKKEQDEDKTVNKKRPLSPEESKQSQMPIREAKKKFEEKARINTTKEVKISDYMFRGRANSIAAINTEEMEPQTSKGIKEKPSFFPTGRRN